MKKLFTILKVTTMATFGMNKLKSNDRAEQKKARNKLLLYAFVIVCLLFSFFSYMLLFKSAFIAMGIPEAILAIGIGGASILTIITALFRTSNVLFAFSDYDLLLSLPIKRSTVVATRMFVLYVFDLAFCLIVMIPAAVIYGMSVEVNALFYLLCFVLTLIMPMLPALIGGLIGTLAGLIVSRFKNKRIFTTLLYALFMLVYFVFMFTSDFEVTSDIAGSVLDKLYSFYPVARWFSDGIYNIGSGWINILWYSLANIGAALVAYAVLSCTFEWLHNKITYQSTSGNFKLTHMSVTNVSASLRKREFKRYVNTPIYLMNTAVGYIIVLVGVVLLMLNFGDIAASVTAEMGMIASALALPIAFILIMTIGLSTTTSSAISIEGRYIWILKTFPISAYDIFAAKLSMNLFMSIPVTVIADTVLMLTIKPDALTCVLVAIVTLIACFFYSVFGLYVDLHMPKLTWKTETEVVKQGIPVLLVNVLGAMFVPAIPIAIAFLLPKVNMLLVTGVFSLIMLVLTVLMFRSLKYKSEEHFKSLA